MIIVTIIMYLTSLSIVVPLHLKTKNHDLRTCTPYKRPNARNRKVRAVHRSCIGHTRQKIGAYYGTSIN